MKTNCTGKPKDKLYRIAGITQHKENNPDWLTTHSILLQSKIYDIVMESSRLLDGGRGGRDRVCIHKGVILYTTVHFNLTPYFYI